LTASRPRRRRGSTRSNATTPYEFPIEVLRERLDPRRGELTGLNTEQGDPARGERGRAAVPGAEAQFRRDFDQALTYATALGASVIHVMAGVAAPSSAPKRARPM
jgi:hydroxypyruvate isomerase